MAAARLHIGVIGTGLGSRLHLPGFRALPDVEVIAVCGLPQAAATTVAREFGIPNVYTEFRQLLADPAVEAVAIATPPHQHHQLTIAALLAGKHVLCEQPLARTVAEARDMLRQAEAAGVVHMVNHAYRYLPAQQHIRTLVADGYLGTLRTVNLTLFHDSPADLLGLAQSWLLDRDRGGGILSAIGSTLVDTLMWWFGPITGVAGRVTTAVTERRDPRTGQSRPVTADDTCTLMLEYASGAIGSVHLSSAARCGSGERLEAYGSEGTLVLTNDGTLLGARQRSRGLHPLPLPVPHETGIAADSPPLLAAFVRLARGFVTAIHTGQPQPPSFADGLRVQEVISAAQKSAQDGQWATIGTGSRSLRSLRNPLQA